MQPTSPITQNTHNPAEDQCERISTTRGLGITEDSGYGDDPPWVDGQLQMGDVLVVIEEDLRRQS